MEQTASMEIDDKSLIEAHCRGEKTAFEEILRRYGDGLLGYLTRMSGSRDDAEDLFQETFQRVHAKAHTFRGGNLRSWIFRIATNVAISGFRKSRQLRAVSLDRQMECADGHGCDGASIVEADASSEPSRQVLLGERKEQVRRAIGQLPARQRAAVVLAYYQRMTYRQAAEAMGCSLGAVKTQMNRALKSLARTLPEVSGDVI